MSFNQEQETVLKSGNNENIMKVDSLRAQIDNTENDVKIRKAPSMEILLNWIKFGNHLYPKLCTFLALVESVSLYGSETWTLTSLEKNINVSYTRLLRIAFRDYWQISHLTDFVR